MRKCRLANRLDVRVGLESLACQAADERRLVICSSVAAGTEEGVLVSGHHQTGVFGSASRPSFNEQ